jgi:TetR/AcrR family transcriptional regulator
MPKQRSPKRRSNGNKPQRRDPVATRKKLLTAARREFAQSGLAGARVDEIADRAGVNKQLVYHYFGDKDALYLAVLEWVYEEIRAQERKLNLEGLPPERAIKKLIESSFDHLAAHPDFIVLLNDENRGGARHVRGSRKIETMHSPLVSMVSKILKQGVRAGSFRKGINPVHLLLEHANLVGDLRQGPRQSGGEADPPQTRRRPGDAVASALATAVIARSEATKQSSGAWAILWIASRSLSSGAHSRDPLARNDDLQQ